jgi:hypothetical protein
MCCHILVFPWYLYSVINLWNSSLPDRLVCYISQIVSLPWAPLWTKYITSIWNETEMDCESSACWSKHEIEFVSKVSWPTLCCLHVGICNHRNSLVIFSAWSWPMIMTHKGLIKDFPSKQYHVCNINASAVLSTHSVNTHCATST